MPQYYRSQLYSQYLNLHQDTTVTNYMAKFEEFTLRCELQETAKFTIFWFIDGLHTDVKREILLQQYKSIEEAYHKVFGN